MCHLLNGIQRSAPATRFSMPEPDLFVEQLTRYGVNIVQIDDRFRVAALAKQRIARASHVNHADSVISSGIRREVFSIVIKRERLRGRSQGGGISAASSGGSGMRRDDARSPLPTNAATAASIKWATCWPVSQALFSSACSISAGSSITCLMQL